MSWSATEEIAPRVRAVLSAAVQSGLQLEHVEQPTRMQQFEHLRRLTALLHAKRPPEWVFFSDDDDLWSERRCELYTRQCAAAPSSTRVVLCRRKATFASRECTADVADA